MSAPKPERIIVALSWAAGELKVSTETARRWAEKGELPGAFKIGAQWRVSVPVFYREVERRASEHQRPPTLDELRAAVPQYLAGEGPALVRRPRPVSPKPKKEAS